MSATKADERRARKRAWLKANPERRLANSAWSRANKDKVRELKRAWRIKNRERARAYVRAWRKRNPDRAREDAREWAKANRKAMNALAANRRARETNAPGPGITPKQWRQILSDSLGLCAYCNTRKPLTMDHIDPLSKGGAHDTDNAAAVCGTCNSSKHDKPLLLWLAGG